MVSTGFVFVGILGHASSEKALLYHVIDVNTGEVKCGKLYRLDDDNRATVHTEMGASFAVHKDGSNPHIVNYKNIIESEYRSN